MDQLPEKQWKIFREIKQHALDRYCRRVLDEVDQLITDTDQTNHARYQALFGLIQDRDKQLASIFDGTSRSRAPHQLLALQEHGLLTDEEFARFDDDVQEFVNLALSEHLAR